MFFPENVNEICTQQIEYDMVLFEHGFVKKLGTPNLHICSSGWWFQTCFYFPFIYGIIPTPLTNSYFSEGLKPPTSQWEFQVPKMEVLYHMRPYVVGIFPYIGLKNRPYTW